MVSANLVQEITQVFNGISGENHIKPGSFFHFGIRAVRGEPLLTMESEIASIYIEAQRETFDSKYSIEPVPIKAKILNPVRLEHHQVRFARFFSTAVYTATDPTQGLKALVKLYPPKFNHSKSYSSNAN
jgi:hypothetical protein